MDPGEQPGEKGSDNAALSWQPTWKKSTGQQWQGKGEQKHENKKRNKITEALRSVLLPTTICFLVALKIYCLFYLTQGERLWFMCFISDPLQNVLV